MIEHTKLAGRGERGRLGISFVAGALPQLLPACIGTYRHRHPEIRLELREGVTAKQREALLAGEMDVGFVRPVASDSGELTTRRLLSEPMMLALCEDHPLAKMKRVPIHALASETLILFSRKDAFYFYNIVSEILQRADVTPDVVQDATQLYTVVALVSSHIGVAIVPASARHMRFPGVTFRHLAIEKPASAVLDLAWRAEDSHPALTHFLDIAIAEADRYSRNNPV